MKKTFIISIITSCVLSACSTGVQRHPITDATNLNQLQNAMEVPPRPGDAPDANNCNSVSAIRLKALEDTALSLSAQGGLSWASNEIDCSLQKDHWHLDTIFNFSGMMLSHGVIPPVLVQGDNSLNLADPNTIRVADKTYKIIQQARFATTPPNWREYLWMSFPKPEIPNSVLLPKTAEESKIWRKAIKAGWDRGVQQAYNIFQQDLARLKRDYQGMILYRKLLEQKMISVPFVSRTELGVTGDGSDMRINDQVLRITELPKLQTDSSGWKAIVVTPNDDTNT